MSMSQTSEKNESKKTRLGMKRKEEKQKALPTGWREVKLGEVCNVITSPVDKKTVDGELPIKLCNYTDVYYNNTIDSKIDFMTATANHREIEKFSLVKGDVIITKDSETPDDIGVPAYVKETIDNLLCGYHLTILRPKKQTIGKYICYALTSPRVKNNFYRFANGITRFGLTTESYQKIKIPFPSLSEQKAIASLLETWDTAIEKTEALIAAKEKQFKWLLRKLITENCSKWEYIRAITLFKAVSIKGFSNEQLLSVTQDRGVIPRNMLEGRVMSPKSGTQGYRLVIPGNFVISLRSFQGGLEYSRFRGIVSPAYTVLSPKKEIVDLFYKYFFKSHIFIEKYLSLSVIGIRDGKQISFPAFETVKLPYPKLNEQRRITNILSTANKEIELFKQLAEQYRIQKCSLMQRLLTGKWRVSNQ